MTYVTADGTDQELRAIAARLARNIGGAVLPLIQDTFEPERRLAKLEAGSIFENLCVRISLLERKIVDLESATPPNLQRVERRKFKLT